MGCIVRVSESNEFMGVTTKGKSKLFGALEITHDASESLHVDDHWAFEMLR